MVFKERSYEKEYLDSSTIEQKDLFRNLKELHIINTLLGGYNASLIGLKDILKKRKDLINILDIGFGGGDSIKQLSNYAAKLNLHLFFYGVDLKEDCIRYATENLITIPNKELICEDYRDISAELLTNIDVIHCSLFLHHLTDEEIISLFKFCKTNECIVLVNDLHRHWLAYYSIKFLTALFSKSYLVKNDAPLSVRRGFLKAELASLLTKAGFTEFSITWTWAFRFRIIAYK
ncbi:MAG: SAM-dependent methyltransferase [Bacteroidetes bacterium B1(2017)]|nr:MAG: SAM-dependent methyltransferase [Bacteroidetes bacterium B1(2017)]